MATPSHRRPSRPRTGLAVLTGFLLSGLASALPITAPQETSPYAVLDPQNWVNPDNMTWDDFTPVPGTDWANPKRRGSERNFNIALVVLDYPDRPFVVTQPAGSTVFGNPLPIVSELDRDDVPAYYRDLLNKPQDLNRGHTIHEYWMEDSFGRFGVDLAAFGPYRMPAKAYQYGVESDMNPGACPAGDECGFSIREAATAAWQADVGNGTAASYELVFILSAGQDESSTWQEFGEMRFQSKGDVPDRFGPPGTNGTNYAKTRYVDWTSWQAAASLWPDAGGGSSVQAESSGTSTFAHELSHLLHIGDNYNNPYGDPPRRAYTGPWSMMSRGTFNGPGGPHSRWQIPALQGSSMGSLHTVRDKTYIGLVGNESTLSLSRTALARSGLAVARVGARCADPGDDGLLRINVVLDGDERGDLSPPCDTDKDPLCDGGGYDNYNLEVVDRMGSDSFTPDAGVLISKTKDSDDAPFQWVVDANPRDIGLVDFYRPASTANTTSEPVMVTVGDYRQLADALFHAGTRSGSQFEHVDEANGLHFYVVDRHRDSASNILSYTLAVRSLHGNGASVFGASLGVGVVPGGREATEEGVTCEFELSNNGTFAGNATDDGLGWDVYRLDTEVEQGAGWQVALPNSLAAARFGGKTTARIAVGPYEGDAEPTAVVRLTATSESDPTVVATGRCTVKRG